MPNIKKGPTGSVYRSQAWARQRSRILARDGARCRQCRRAGNYIDHIIPLRLWIARRGAEPYPDELLQVLCASCSGRKDGGRKYA